MVDFYNLETALRIEAQGGSMVGEFDDTHVSSYIAGQR
jgi:hypothetical protein